MEKRRLGQTDLEVSIVGFGGIPIQGLPFAEAERVLLHALDRGIDFFDSARAYTDSEEKMGRALSPHRNRIHLASKALSRTGTKITEELETSLRNLRTDTIDLYQVHSVGTTEQLDTIMAPGGAYEALAGAREQGKIRWIGITGHSRPVLLAAVETGLFDTVQCPFNPIEDEWADEVLPEARKAGIGTIGMKPLAGGAIRNAAASIRFSLTRGIDVSIPGMDSITQIEENTAAGEKLEPLTAAELEDLRREKEIWGDSFCRRCAYCMPCPNGLNIPFLLLIDGYYTRYELKDWALARLGTLEKTFADCAACGECIEKCPYHLPVPELMERAAEHLI
ncbi:MAG: aldo/keto reductase [bacterium]|nr:MAG: aldo/keto reductase [bacterium]